RESVKTYSFLFFLLLFSLFMSSIYSQFIWDKIKYLWYLQFPWRFLTFTGMFISLIAAAGIYYLGKIIKQNNKVKQIIFNLIIILLLVVTVVKYLIYSKPHGEKTYDERKLKDSTVKIVIQIDGKVRDLMEAEADLDEEEIKVLTLKRENVKKWIVDKGIKKFIFIKNKLVNIVPENNANTHI
ncbi:MAG: Leucine-tRNA ligase, partial [Parcubacteria group bacterium GW2011_GWB2_40_8]